MKAKLILRIAAVIMLLHAMGHTVGVYTWNQPIDAHYGEVVNGMSNNKFVFMGATCTLGRFYEGFGYAATLAMLLMVGILWIVSGATGQNNELVKKIVVLLSVILLFWGILELIYFFPFAASFSLIASVLGFYSLVAMNKE